MKGEVLGWPPERERVWACAPQRQGSRGLHACVFIGVQGAGFNAGR
jgi:hypothetical protein